MCLKNFFFKGAFVLNVSKTVAWKTENILKSFSFMENAMYDLKKNVLDNYEHYTVWLCNDINSIIFFK